MKDAKTGIAPLDVDGTLYPGTLGIDLLRVLMRAELCDLDAAAEVFAIGGAHQRDEIDFETMARGAYEAYARALAGRSCAEVEAQARALWEKKRGKLFAFAPTLIAELRASGRVPLLISGSPIEMVRLVADELGIEEAHGAVFARAEGRYTGSVALGSGVPGAKAEILAGAFGRRPRDLQRSFAMGDSLTDVAMFEEVGIALAFEPTVELAELAQTRGWPVATRGDVLERVRTLLCLERLSGSDRTTFDSQGSPC
ncbi:haloacid dehalogenase-like hydrolase [Pseudenhygromyxa sp. WMMC2535]|uniref:haloacid dehalogenase-like hydrolase n=1 Tax=Pseudenhygromyxa sp. WMMC2535 TaxID=2712867 RepID=UPI001594F6B7|nr:haloacid dehalogenase-like hydrolase [Pseudenhygromyxa sp. WMMC2535]